MLSGPGLSRLIGSLSLHSIVIRSLSTIHSRPITCVSYPNKIILRWRRHMDFSEDISAELRCFSEDKPASPATRTAQIIRFARSNHRQSLTRRLCDSTLQFPLWGLAKGERRQRNQMRVSMWFPGFARLFHSSCDSLSRRTLEIQLHLHRHLQYTA